MTPLSTIFLSDWSIDSTAGPEIPPNVFGFYATDGTTCT